MALSKSVLGTLIGALVLAVSIFVFWPDTQPKPALAHVSAPTAPVASGPLQHTPGSLDTTAGAPAANKGKPDPWAETSLVANLKKSTSYRSFIHDALRDPEKGGAFYAQTVLKQCQQARFAVDSASTSAPALSERAKAVLAGFNARCDMSDEEYQSSYRILQSLEGRDPMLKVAGDMSSADPGVKRAALAQAFQSQDPFLLFETGALSFYRKAPTAFGAGSESLQTYFNGQWLNEADAIPLQYAEKLAACDFAAPCQQEDTWLNEQCLAHGECANSRQEYLDRYVYPVQPEWRLKIQRYYSTIKAAIESGSVDTFVPAS